MGRTASRAIGVALGLAAFAAVLLLARPGAEDRPREPPGGRRGEPAVPLLKGLRTDGGAPASDVSAPPQGGTNVRVLAKETRAPLGGAHWRVDGLGRQAVAEGVTDPDGLARLAAGAVDAWEQGVLRIWAEGRRDESVRISVDPRDRTVEVLLGKLHVEFSGVVLDDLGRPLPGAGVVVQYWNAVSSREDGPEDFFRATTDGEGRFHVAAPVWYPDDDLFDGHEILAGAPGFAPASMAPDKRGEEGIVLRLAREGEGVVFEIRATLPDGTPASGADLWFEGLPPGEAASRFAEVWREPWDPRPPGWGTWVTVGGRRTWWARLDAAGAASLHPVPPGTHRLQVRCAAGAADVTVDVAAAPAVTRAPVRLRPLRVLTGSVRVTEDLRWRCAHETHEHEIRYPGWPDPAEPRKVPSGSVHRTDLPVGVVSVSVVTGGHPEVAVPIPAEGDVLLDEVVVPAARVLEGVLRWPSGKRPEPCSEVRLVDGDGIVAKATTYWTSSGGPIFRLVLPRAPAPDAWLVVRLRMADGEASPEVRLDGPFDVWAAEPLDVPLPPSVPPARED